MPTPVVLPADVFDPPPLSPSPIGLYRYVQWVTSGDPARFLLNEGILIRPHNYGGSSAFGVWNSGWCANPGSVTPKAGDRPDISALDPFVGETVFGYDHNYCANLTQESRDEVAFRAQHNLDLLEQVAAERQLADRMLDDAGTPTAVTGITAAIGLLEGAILATGVPGFIHLGGHWAARLANAQLYPDDEMSPLDYPYVFGGGYVDGLDDVIVATSQIFGWKGDVQVNTAIQYDHNEVIAVAERSVLLGYEKLIAAVQVS